MKPISVAVNQWKKFSDLGRSVKMFIVVTIFFGLFFSVRNLFFNFYILSLGFDKDFLGVANSISPAATLILGLPLGVLTDRIGRKTATIIGLIVQVAGYSAMLLTSSGTFLLVTLFISGTGETLFFISRTPLLTRLTDKRNRDYVFSLDYALLILAGVVGNSLAGQMPNWFEALFNIIPETPASYQGVLFAGLSLALLALLPTMMIKTGARKPDQVAPNPGKINRNSIHKLQSIMRKTVVWKLIVPNSLIGFGAALMVPYLNLFFVETFGINNQVLGNLFSAASLFTGLTVLAGPWLATRLRGRIRAIVITQTASLVFLLAVGFSPWLGLAMIGFLGREALMNMVAPINTAFSIEQVEEDEQGTFNSLFTLSWQIGWVLMPLVSGIIQERYGFTPIFLITGALYAIGTGLFWIFFKNADQHQTAQPTP